ncbi:MAG: tetratricopeptide repeat protein [Bacteroidota bacterium]|nr:tetratricopeptide repeat protein [Bacteroidota bacterium]
MPGKKLFSFIILFLAAVAVNGQKISREQRYTVETYLKQIRGSSDAAEDLVLANKVLQIDSTNIKAIGNRAFSYFILNDYSESLKNFNLYLKKRPNSSFCIYRAQLKMAMGDTAGALVDIERALTVSGYSEEIADILADFLGKDKRVIMYFEKIIKLHPNNYRAHAVLGLAKENMKDYIGAAERYSSAVQCVNQTLFNKKRSDGRWVFRLKSSLDIRLKNYDNAIKSLTQAILLYPEEPNYYRSRMRCYLEIGDQDKACADLWQLQKMGKVPYTYESKCDSTKISCKPSKEWLINIEVEKFYLKGASISLFDTTTFKQAIYYYSKALEFNPNHIYSLAGRSYNYLLLNQLDKQIEDINKILKIDPKCSQALSFRAGAMRDIGKYHDALIDINNSIRLDSTNTESWVMRASIKARTGDTASAIIDLSKAIELNPYFVVTYIERGLLQLNFSKNAESALKDCLKAIDLEENEPFHGGLPTLHNNCSMAYNQLGQYDKALEQIEKAIALKPNYPMYYFRAGEIKARMEDMKGACEDWNKSKQLGYKDAEELILYNCK